MCVALRQIRIGSPIPQRSRSSLGSFWIRATATIPKTRHRMPTWTQEKHTTTQVRNSSKTRTKSLPQTSLALQTTISSTWMTSQMAPWKNQSMRTKLQVRSYKMESRTWGQAKLTEYNVLDQATTQWIVRKEQTRTGWTLMKTKRLNLLSLTTLMSVMINQPLRRISFRNYHKQCHQPQGLQQTNMTRWNSTRTKPRLKLNLRLTNRELRVQGKIGHSGDQASTKLWINNRVKIANYKALTNKIGQKAWWQPQTKPRSLASPMYKPRIRMNCQYLSLHQAKIKTSPMLSSKINCKKEMSPKRTIIQSQSIRAWPTCKRTSCTHP